MPESDNTGGPAPPPSSSNPMNMSLLQQQQQQQQQQQHLLFNTSQHHQGLAGSGMDALGRGVGANGLGAMQPGPMQQMLNAAHGFGGPQGQVLVLNFVHVRLKYSSTVQFIYFVATV
jgi:hypothetical protein